MDELKLAANEVQIILERSYDGNSDELENACMALEKAINKAHSSQTEDIIYALEMLAEAYVTMDNPTGETDTLLRMCKHLKPNSMEIADVYIRLGNLYIDLEKYKKAEKALSKASKIYEDMAESDINKYGHEIISAFIAISDAYYVGDYIEDAKESLYMAIYYTRKIEETMPDDMQLDMIDIHKRLATLHAATDKNDLALAEYAIALSFADPSLSTNMKTRFAVKIWRKHIHLLMAKLSYDKDPSEQISHVEEAVKIVEQLADSGKPSIRALTKAYIRAAKILYLREETVHNAAAYIRKALNNLDIEFPDGGAEYLNVYYTLYWEIPHFYYKTAMYNEAESEALTALAALAQQDFPEAGFFMGRFHMILSLVYDSLDEDDKHERHTALTLDYFKNSYIPEEHAEFVNEIIKMLEVE